jgi:hypothetical protein
MSASDSAPPPRPTAPGAHSSRLAGIGLIALMLGVAVMIAAVFLIVWEVRHGQQASTPQPAGVRMDDLAALRARLARDEARLAALEKPAQGESQGDLAARVAKLETSPDPAAAARLADLELRLAALEHSEADLPPRVSALQTNQDTLAARVTHLEAVDPTAAMKRAAAELALVNLVRASADGPFDAELKTFAALMPDAPEAKDLASIAPHGAPPQAELAARFPDVAAKALAAEKSAAAQGWLALLWANIANVVVVRHVGEAKGASSEAILARASARLSVGDLAGAVTETETLKGATRASAQAWIAHARARLTIARATAALAGRMAKLLAAP